MHKSISDIDKKIFEQAFNQSPISILITDVKGNIQYINEAFTNVTGYTVEEVTGKNPKIISSGMNSADTYKELWESILKGKTWSGELLNKKKDGTLYWENEVISAVFNDKDEITNFVCTKEDITERKKAEVALINSESRFQLFFKQSNAIILVVDTEKQKIVEANEAAIKYYGYTLTEFQLINIKPEFVGFIEAVMAETDQFISHFRNIYAQKHRLKNKQWRDVEIYPARVEHKEKTLIYVIIHDITQRKKAIEALKESESKKLALLKIIPDLIFVLTAKGIFLDIYSDKPDRLGVEPQKLLGKHINQYFPKEMCGIVLKKIEGAISSREVQLFEYRYKKDKGRYAFDEIRIIASGDGEVLAIIRDISKQKSDEIEIKKAWEEAEEANRLKSVFLANISHEIRTPINAILGFSDLLSDELRNTTHRQYVEVIKSSSKTLLNLINDLLDLSKIEAGKMNVTLIDTNIRTLFSEIENVFSIRIKEKKLDYNCFIENSVPSIIVFDELRLRQILYNLIGNALKFTDNGKIEVVVRAEKIIQHNSPERVRLIITIKDTGVGIDKKNHEEIFEAFKQQDTQDARKYGGTGLGLTITKRLVEMLNGVIELESSPGRGSIFTLTFRDVETFENTNAETVKPVIYKVGKIIFKPIEVLVADDAPTNREFMKGIFKGSDMTFFEAEDGQESIEIIKNIKPALALLDLRMPKVDGLEVAKFIKTSDEFKNIITFGISATIIDKTDLRNNFLDEFIAKPVDIAEILKKIARHIEVVQYLNENGIDKLFFDYENMNKSTTKVFIEKAYIDLHAILEQISHTSSFTDYETFSKILIAKGSELKINQLTYIGSAINEAVKSFDLDRISTLIQTYSIFEKRLLNISHE
jgi:PAS domain S-box-containing protein